MQTREEVMITTGVDNSRLHAGMVAALTQKGYVSVSVRKLQGDHK